MNMPGFTGEASLYKTGRHYYKAGNLTQPDGVYPATITMIDMVGVPVVYYPWAELTDVHPWTTWTTVTRCCSKCYRDCRRECSDPFGGRPDPRCVNFCLDYDCTHYCNAYHLGGCRHLLGV
jgi:hypothetical protein